MSPPQGDIANDLQPNDVVPRLRADLKVTKSEGKFPASFEVALPSGDMSFSFQDFEMSLARMLNGERTAEQVIEAAEQIGIPLDLFALQRFLGQLRRGGLLDESGLPPPPPPPTQPPLGPGAPTLIERQSSTWGSRDRWDETIRKSFQSALKLFRNDKHAEAKAELEALLAQQPENAEALDLMRQVEQKLAEGSQAQPFAKQYSDVESHWFKEGDKRRTIVPRDEPDDDDEPVKLKGQNRKWFVIAGLLLALLVVAAMFPMNRTVRVPCKLLPTAETPVRAPQSATVREVPAAEGQWVEKGAVLVKLGSDEAKKKLPQLDAQLAGIKAALKKSEGEGKALDKAKAAQDKLEADLKKAKAEADKVKAASKGKKTPALAKAQKKVTELEAQVKKGAAALAAQQKKAPARDKLQSDLTRLTQEREATAHLAEGVSVTSPTAGFLADVKAKAGGAIAAGDVIATVQEAKTLKVVAPLTDAQRSAVKTGQTLAIDAPGAKKPLAAKVTAISEAGEATGTLENADASVKPGDATASFEMTQRLIASFGK